MSPLPEGPPKGDPLMILYGVGVGPGDPELVTLKALRVLREADLLLEPLSAPGRTSVAGSVVRRHLEAPLHPLVFPMSGVPEERDEALKAQLATLAPLLEGVRSVALPVIGDAALYATVGSLFDVWRSTRPDLELRLVPGLSAHSLAACSAGSFLAMGEESFLVAPASAPFDRLTEALSGADAAALYKPSALRERLPELVRATGPWARTVRVHRAGLPEERTVSGPEATLPTEDYLSVLLLWRSPGRTF